MTILTLPETLDRKAISDLSEKLLTHRGSEIVMDAAGLRKISTLGIEMLIAARHQWNSDGANIELRNWTDELLAALDRVGARSSLLSNGDGQ